MTLAISIRVCRRAHRRAPLAALLASMLLVAATGSAGAADTLYRWSEPDGSLTYSPTPPTDGTPYDTVDPAATAAAATAADVDGGTPDVAQAVLRAATEPPSIAISRPVTPPGSGAATPPPGVGAGAASVPDGAADRRGTFRGSPSARAAGAAGIDEKTRRCSELGKRVVSLEQRLATPLTPEAMDATVVQMARYQQSVENHCR